MDETWHPGSFTKNFSWGPVTRGLKELYTIIRAGFANELTDTPRKVFRERVAELGRPDYIALNFFLLNERRFGTDFVVVDELVFQALTQKHSANFDKLALFAFILSRVGAWKNALPYQTRPALWAYHYVADRVAADFNWNTSQVTTNDIETFIANDNRYTGKTSRKLATNLAYLFKVGRLSGFESRKPDRWWLGALFLALDRMVDPTAIDNDGQSTAQLTRALAQSGFSMISGKRSIAKDVAASYFIPLYRTCGGRTRFSTESTQARQANLIPHPPTNYIPEPVGLIDVFHNVDARARKSLPKACFVLARYVAGFEVIEDTDMSDFDIEKYIERTTREAIQEIKSSGITPSISADDLIRLMRD